MVIIREWSLSKNDKIADRFESCPAILCYYSTKPSACSCWQRRADKPLSYKGGLGPTIYTHADSSRVSIAIIRVCDSVILRVILSLYVCPMIKPKRLKLKSANLAEE